MERLVDNTTVGNIQGVVSNTLVPSGCTPGVYLYNGTVTAPEDMNSTAPPSDTNQPLASKVPVADSQPPYYYQFTFLPPGTYTVAFTCQATQDNPDQADGSVKFNPVRPELRLPLTRRRRSICRQFKTGLGRGLQTYRF